VIGQPVDVVAPGDTFGLADQVVTSEVVMSPST
jgi:hypothetical protein